MKGFGRFLVKSTPEGDNQLVRIVTTLVRIMVQFLYQEERKITADNAPMVGIDVGVKAQATLSTVEGLPQVVIDTTRQKRLQRRVSAATKGSATENQGTPIAGERGVQGGREATERRAQNDHRLGKATQKLRC